MGDLRRPPQRGQGGGGHAGRLARGPVAARQRQREQPAEALPRGALDQQHLAAPVLAGGPHPVPVERETQDRPVRPCSPATAATCAA